MVWKGRIAIFRDLWVLGKVMKEEDMGVVRMGCEIGSWVDLGKLAVHLGDWLQSWLQQPRI